MKIAASENPHVDGKISGEPCKSTPDVVFLDNPWKEHQRISDQSAFPYGTNLMRVAPAADDNCGFWRDVVPSANKPAPTCAEAMSPPDSDKTEMGLPRFHWEEVNGGTAIIGKRYLVLAECDDPTGRTMAAMRTLTARFLHTLQDAHNELEFDKSEVLPQGNVSLYVPVWNDEDSAPVDQGSLIY